MPTNTFNNLSDDKKKRILDAGRKEFSRVSLHDASIKNIVEDASIARGSFYQYFESKQDLLKTILDSDWKLSILFNKFSEKNSIDIFDFYRQIFEHIFSVAESSDKKNLYIKVFENIKVSDDEREFFSWEKADEIDECIKNVLIQKIDKTSLTITSVDELLSLSRILFLITRGMIVYGLAHDNMDKARAEFDSNINMLKYGVCKKKGFRK